MLARYVRQQDGSSPHTALHRVQANFGAQSPAWCCARPRKQDLSLGGYVAFAPGDTSLLLVHSCPWATGQEKLKTYTRSGRQGSTVAGRTSHNTHALSAACDTVTVEQWSSLP
eukprot:3080489-Rhodomonas_salina.4